MCITPGCDNEIKHPKLGLCTLCYSSMLRWDKRPQRDQVERLEKLRMFESRMTAMMPSDLTKPKFKMAQKPLQVLPGHYKKKPFKRRRA